MGWPVRHTENLIFGSVSLHFRGLAARKYFFTFQSTLGHNAVLKVTKIKKLFASLSAKGQPMGSTLDLPALGANEPAFRIEDHHRVQAVAVRKNRMEDVDVPL